MDRDVATGKVLNPAVSSDVVTVTVGADDKGNIPQRNPELFNPPRGFVESGNIPGIDQNRRIAAIYEVVCIQIAAFYKKHIR